MPRHTLFFAKKQTKQWVNPHAAKAVEMLASLGFSDVGSVTIARLPSVKGQAFIHAQERAYALMTVDYLRPVGVDIFSLHPKTENGCYGVTSAVDPSSPVEFACRMLPKVPVDMLFAEYLKGRPDDAQPVSAGKLTAAYEVLVAAHKALKEETDSDTQEEVVLEGLRQAYELRKQRPALEFRQLLRGLRRKDETIYKDHYGERGFQWVDGEAEYPPLLEAKRSQALKRALELLALPEVREGVNTDLKYETPLAELVIGTEIPELVSAFLNSGATADTKLAALTYACSLKSKDLPTLILHAGVDPTDGLFRAVNYGDAALVKMCLEAGADATARRDGQLPKAWAQGPHKREILALLEKKAPKPPVAKGSALKFVKAKRPFKVATARGIKEFREGINNPEWAIGMIEAPAAEVAAAYAKLQPKAKWFADTAVKAVYAEPEVQFLFQLKGHSWCNLIALVGEMTVEVWDEFPAIISALSNNLRCRAVLYMAEDVGGDERYEIFDQGQKIESADRYNLRKFTSTFRTQPKEKGKDFPDAALASLGTYLPYLETEFDGECVKLAVTGVPLEAFARVDAFKLKARAGSRVT